MRWIDLLRMSSNSLKRRKLRTFLTVLGVVIGTASIVVMISLGLGLQESMYQEIEQSGGVTSLTVTGKGSSQMGGFYMGDTNNEEEATKYTTDDVIEQIKKLDHVADAVSYTHLIWKGKVSNDGTDHELCKTGTDCCSSSTVFYWNGIKTVSDSKG